MSTASVSNHRTLTALLYAKAPGAMRGLAEAIEKKEPGAAEA